MLPLGHELRLSIGFRSISRSGSLATFGVLKPIALTLRFQDVTSVGKSVEDSTDESFTSENLTNEYFRASPPSERPLIHVQCCSNSDEQDWGLSDTHPLTFKTSGSFTALTHSRILRPRATQSNPRRRTSARMEDVAER